MQDNLKSITTTTTKTITYEKIVSENNDGTIELSFDQKDNWEETPVVQVQKVPLSPKYENNLKKLNPKLAEVVDESNQENKEIVKKAMEKTNDMLRDYEKKSIEGTGN